MHIFTDYIQPITLWLHTHPHWAIVLTLIISFTESLAIIGSIIPGSVTMTAIGILAGSGVMRIDLTLFAATLGAIIGDSTSYLLGYAFSDRLPHFWPFSRYPDWLTYGKKYFARHGGKSVLIGRFIGPLRSIIPLIAGMMHMNHWHFYLSNVISAIAWSLLYILPGVLIGAASNELSPESATRLFGLVLFLLGVIWLLTLIIKWLITQLNRFLNTRLHLLWSWLSHHPKMGSCVKFFTPVDEKNHYPTAGLFLLSFSAVIGFFTLALLIFQKSWLLSFNNPINLVLQSLRTNSFDVFFISVTQFCSPFTLSIIFFIIALALLYRGDWRSLRYWLSLLLSCTVLLYLLHDWVISPRPSGLLDVKEGYSFPASELTYASVIFSAFLFYINRYYQSILNAVLNIFFLILLFLAGFAEIYLGDHWLSDVIGAYFAGLSITLIHWLFYRRKLLNFCSTTLSEKNCFVDITSTSSDTKRLEIGHTISYRPSLSAASLGKNSLNEPYRPYLLIIILFTLIFSAILSGLLNYHQDVKIHQPYFAQHVFTDQAWWKQKSSLLPIYRTNRFGKPVGLFNVQYAGSLNRLESALSAFGWQKENESLYKSILKRLNHSPGSIHEPLMAQLYLNRKPVLMMSYKPNNAPTLILRLWRSNYHLLHYRQPIWLGSIYPRNLAKNPTLNNDIESPLFYLSKALIEFLQQEIPLTLSSDIKLPLIIAPKLLLVKELPSGDLLNMANSN